MNYVLLVRRLKMHDTKYLSLFFQKASLRKSPTMSSKWMLSFQKCMQVAQSPSPRHAVREAFFMNLL